ncbi:hypothetical protein Q7P35_009764 [Cladosporium inversicolor]
MATTTTSNLPWVHHHKPQRATKSRPSSTFPVDNRARDKFYMTAADPAGLSSAEDRLHKLLKAKYDAGMLKPFNYVKGYAKLNTYMEKNISRISCPHSPPARALPTEIPRSHAKSDGHAIGARRDGSSAV